MTIPVPAIYPPDRRPLVTKFADTLRSVTGRPIGIVNVPSSETGALNPEAPYAIVYPSPGGMTRGGPFEPVPRDTDYVIQVTSVGETYEQAEWMAHRVRRTILGCETNGSFTFDLTTPNILVIERLSESGPGDVMRAEKLYTSIERFVLRTTHP